MNLKELDYASQPRSEVHRHVSAIAAIFMLTPIFAIHHLIRVGGEWPALDVTAPWVLTAAVAAIGRFPRMGLALAVATLSILLTTHVVVYATIQFAVGGRVGIYDAALQTLHFVLLNLPGFVACQLWILASNKIRGVWSLLSYVIVVTIIMSVLIHAHISHVTSNAIRGDLDEALKNQKRFNEVRFDRDMRRLPLWYPVHVVSIIRNRYDVFDGKFIIVSDVEELAQSTQGVFGTARNNSDVAGPRVYFFIKAGTSRVELFQEPRAFEDCLSRHRVEKAPMRNIVDLVEHFQQSGKVFYAR